MRYTPKLGELQVKILKHMLSCVGENIETVSHISKEIDALQPDVFRSTKLMIRDGMLQKKMTFDGNKKVLGLTEKGMAIAVLEGIKHEKLAEYLRPPENIKVVDNIGKNRRKFFDEIMGLTDRPSTQDFLLRRAINYMIVNGWYDKEKELLDEKERIDLFINLIPFILTHVGDVKTIVQFMDKFEIDKRVFGSLLLRRLVSIVKSVTEYQRYTKAFDKRVEDGRSGWESEILRNLILSMENETPTTLMESKSVEIDAIKLAERIKKQSVKTSEVLSRISQDITERVIKENPIPGEMSTESSLPKKSKKH